jgi:hypothetical protein
VPKKEHKPLIAVGLVIFAVGLALSSAPIIAFGVGMAVSNALFHKRRAASKSRVTAKKHMTAEENNHLISVILPIVRNSGK